MRVFTARHRVAATGGGRRFPAVWFPACERNLRGAPADVSGASSRGRGQSAFTMVEIALCLAIIGFALVAIIGVLPFGLNVQKNNRQETVINQDATVWMDAIRNGAQGMNDLTNYVLGITNYWTRFTQSGFLSASGRDVYDSSHSAVTSASVGPTGCRLTTGARIVGLLSTPRITAWGTRGGFQSNFIVADVRAMSGYAVEKFPQTNTTILDASFSYRFVPEILACQATALAVVTNNLLPVPLDPAAVDLSNQKGTFQERVARTNYARLMWNLETNSYDVRLTFRWPLLPNGAPGDGRQTFRAMNGGQFETVLDPSGQPLYFAKPSFYVKSP
jgi:type II secretory pathway pseudopilin PulG